MKHRFYTCVRVLRYEFPTRELLEDHLEQRYIKGKQGDCPGVEEMIITPIVPVDIETSPYRKGE